MPINTRHSQRRSLFTTAIFALLLLWQLPAWPQDTREDPDVSARELIENTEATEQLLEEKEETDPRSIHEQSTPLASMFGLRTAMRNKDYESAGKFLDRRYLPEDLAQYSDEALIKALTYVWGRQNIIDITSLSDIPEGHLDDGLPSYRDQVGSVVLSSGEVPIYLQQVPDGKGGRIWKLSNSTVEKIPEMWDELGYSPVAIKLSQWLPDFNFMGMNNWQLVATVVFFLATWPLARYSASLWR